MRRAGGLSGRSPLTSRTGCVRRHSRAVLTSSYDVTEPEEVVFFRQGSSFADISVVKPLITQRKLVERCCGTCNQSDLARDAFEPAEPPSRS
jgi:hypothetical protein